MNHSHEDIKVPAIQRDSTSVIKKMFSYSQSYHSGQTTCCFSTERLWQHLRSHRWAQGPQRWGAHTQGSVRSDILQYREKNIRASMHIYFYLIHLLHLCFCVSFIMLKIWQKTCLPLHCLFLSLSNCSWKPLSRKCLPLLVLHISKY